jgi:anti-sigma regulatory factor (Ser/Thr protein kinase)
MAVAVDRVFNERVLGLTRTSIMESAADLGVPRERLGSFVIAAMELVVNVIRHGRGVGRLRLWRADNTLYCQVSDRGPGIPEPDKIGTELADPDAESGRGLWIVRQFSDHLDIVTGATGTTITAVIDGLSPRRS